MTQARYTPSSLPCFSCTPISLKPTLAICRPSEAVLDLLDQGPASFTKEDGEVVHL